MLGEVALEQYRGLVPSAPTQQVERRLIPVLTYGDNAGRGAVHKKEQSSLKSIKAGNEQNVRIGTIV